MSVDAIARGLANKAQSAIANGNLPYAMGSTFSAGTVGRKLQETLSARDFGAKGDGKQPTSGTMTAGSATLLVSLSGFSGFTAADIGKLICVPGAGAAGANLTTTIAGFTSSTTVTLAIAAGTAVSGKQVTFGTDDTAALQAFVTYVANNHLQAFIPSGTYCLNGPINTPHKPGWGISGNGPEATILSQCADNVAILDLGAGTVQAPDAPGFHTILIEELRLSYAAQQPVTNTNAACLAFSSMVYWSTMRRLCFERGYDGIKVRAGVGGPWGSNWDDFRFRSSGGDYLTGSAMDWTGVANGVPNNRWGRMVIEVGQMSKPVFNQVKGYNWTIETLEFLGATSANLAGGTGQQLLALQSASMIEIGCLKLETFSFTGTHAFSGSSLIYAPSGSVRIRQLFFGGTVSIFNTTNALAVFGGATFDFQVEYFTTTLSQAPVNVTLSGASAGRNVVGNSVDGGGNGPIPLTSIGSGAGANFLTYGRNAQRRLSDDIGDANYTATTNGGANVIVAQTALTAARSVEIMPDTNYLFNGYTVTVLSRGAVNGTNTLAIKAGGITKATISSDNYAVELTWRRNPAAHNGWVVTRQGTA